MPPFEQSAKLVVASSGWRAGGFRGIHAAASLKPAGHLIIAAGRPGFRGLLGTSLIESVRSAQPVPPLVSRFRGVHAARFSEGFNGNVSARLGAKHTLHSRRCLWAYCARQQQRQRKASISYLQSAVQPRREMPAVGRAARKDPRRRECTRGCCQGLAVAIASATRSPMRSVNAVPRADHAGIETEFRMVMRGLSIGVEN